jgi:hypothetical protein
MYPQTKLMKQKINHSRRNFIKTSAAFAGAFALANENLFAAKTDGAKVPVYAHLWVYASRYPSDWDCTPILDTVFSDLKYAGLEGVELMEVLLRHDDAVTRLKELIQKHQLPVTGTSYYGDMWNKAEHQRILEDVELVVGRLHDIGGTMLGITVGDAKHV